MKTAPSTLAAVAMAGREQWQENSLGKASLTMSADGRFIIRNGQGELAIARADPQRFVVMARAWILPESKRWTAPVLLNGRTYARNAAGDCVCVNVNK